MHKIVAIYIGAVSYQTVHSIVEIDSDQEYVKLPAYKDEERQTIDITRIGFEQDTFVDTRSDYEKWKDEYYYSYYPERGEQAVEVKVPPCVKKIFIPHTIKRISKLAFKNAKNIQFEIDKDNKYYKVEDNKIIEISSGEIIWPYTE